ncbi:hypothetical protein DYB38_001826 [Aphanomyces astaci]|uniref:Protein kinase domain-containing protein n=2 Tax=Aphanomyces astaci TaxID=112090 RepID=A0A397E2H0_APHAT|nr:hypothetical protein DYB38_001826 [Aphanomyces astaci]
MKASFVAVVVAAYAHAAWAHPWKGNKSFKINDTNVTLLNTFWATSPGLNKKAPVNVTTYSTDCKDVEFQADRRWDNCTEERITCIWFPNGTVGRGSNCRKVTRYGSADYGQVNAFRGGSGSVDRKFDNVTGTNVSTTLFPSHITVEHIEGFPTYVETMFLWNTNITAFYANESQFLLLSNVSTTCEGLSDDGSGDNGDHDYCERLLSHNATNATCKGHVRIEWLHGKYPICIIPDDKRPLNKVTIICAVTIAAGVLVVGVALLAHWRKVQRRHKWYNDSGAYCEDQTATVVTNDIRTDKLISSYRIPPDRIDRGVEIGRGGYGVVYVATIKYGGKATRQVAMKRLLPERTHNPTDVETFMDEIRTCSSIFHPNIVEFVGVTWTTLSNVSLLTEFMAAGDVWSLIEADHRRRRRAIEWHIQPDTLSVDLDDLSTFLSGPDAVYDDEEGPDHMQAHSRFSKFSILCSVVDALVYLHSLPVPIIHRDIKARNVLVNDVGHVKLSDFGTSREGTMDYTMTSEIGTIPWIAPEILKGVRYTEMADIYSVGVLISELDTGEVPYSTMETTSSNDKYPRVAKTKIMMMVVAGDLRPCVTHECPNIIYDVIRRCVAYCPSDRPTAKQLQHWLRQIQREMTLQPHQQPRTTPA